MRNLADVIENFIVGELLTEGNQYVLVQRNELAEKLDCAPSQISYTLSTRFTPDRGFLVESRRGTGGFIRIVRLEQMPTTNQRQPQTLNAEELVHYLQVNSLITPRETQLLNYILELVDGHVLTEQKREIIKEAYQRLLNKTQANKADKEQQRG